MLGNKFLTVNSVKCGELILPFSSLNDRLCNFVRSVVLEADDPIISGSLGRTGSSTLVRLANRNYICLTKHELKDSELSHVRIVSGFGGKLENVTFDSCIYPSGDWAKDEEFSDILLLHAHKQSSDSNCDYIHFFPVRKFSREKIFASLIVACPFYPNNFAIDYETGVTTHYHQTTVVRDCTWDDEFSSHAKYLERFNYIPKEKYPENGMSGGAVFSIVDIDGNLEVFLHGIIVRAGNGKLSVVSADFLLSFRDESVRKQ